MVKIKKANERGTTELDWLKSYHSFSFGDYRDEDTPQFRTLRVMNEDFIEPEKGFGKHPHRDMEIMTYVLSGSIYHEDSMKNEVKIAQGEIQLMSAGKGILHSEFNASSTDDLRLYQIWILPSEKGLEPSYQQRTPYLDEYTDRLLLIISPDAREGSLKIHQDANIYMSRLHAGKKIDFHIDSKRFIWVQVMKGNLALNDVNLNEGDGAAVSTEEQLQLEAIDDTELFIFDLD